MNFFRVLERSQIRKKLEGVQSLKYEEAHYKISALWRKIMSSSKFFLYTHKKIRLTSDSDH